MIKLPQYFCERIEAAMADEKALRDKYRMFLEMVHEEHKALSEKTKATWDEIKRDMGLEGDFRYENGRLFPVNVGPDGAPIHLAPTQAQQAQPVKIVDGAAFNVEVAQA